MEQPFFIKDNIGKNVLLKFGDAIQDVTISHLSPNEQAVYIQYTGENTDRWMTVERFSEAFFDFAPDAPKQAKQTQTARIDTVAVSRHLKSVGFIQRGAVLFSRGDITAKIVDDYGLRVDINDSDTGLCLIGFIGADDLELYKDKDV